jgi:hypothetical protein
VLDQVHRFDMERTEIEVSEIQAELRDIFDAARLMKERQQDQDS